MTAQYNFYYPNLMRGLVGFYFDIHAFGELRGIDTTRVRTG